MSTKKDRYWIRAEGAGQTTFPEGLKWLKEVTTVGKVGLLAVHAKSNLHSTISERIGDRLVKDLEAKRGVRLPGGGTLRLMTERIRSHTHTQRPGAHRLRRQKARGYG